MFYETIKKNGCVFFQIAILLVIFLQFIQCSVSKSTCASDGKSSCTPNDDVSVEDDDSITIDPYASTRNLIGTLSPIEVAKLMPPSTPLPEDITIESIITRSDLIGRTDIITRSDFIFKREINQSSISVIDENDAFNLPVPIGYEFITMVKVDGDVVGLIKYKIGDKYIANVTLKPNNFFKYKGVKEEESVDEIDVGEVTASTKYFTAGKSLSDDVASEPDEELPLSSGDDADDDITTIAMVIDDTKSIDISVESEEAVTFEIPTTLLPDFCTFVDNKNNTATISCHPETPKEPDAKSPLGTHNGIYLSAETESKSKNGHIEFSFEVVEQSIPSLALGGSHSCYLAPNGKIKCWGSNSRGQLGIANDVENINMGDAEGEMGKNLSYFNLDLGEIGRTICASTDYTCVILSDGSVKCSGCLGCGAIKPVRQIDLGSSSVAKSIACGYDHACALLEDGSVKCWGYNESGQLGYGNTKTILETYGEMGDNLPSVNLGSGKKAIAISAGRHFTCAILDDNSLKCWGKNDYGQLGLGDSANRGGNDGEMGDSLPNLLLGTGRTAKSVSCGQYHACAILDNDLVKCWGDNSFFQLGSAYALNNKGDEANEMGENLPYTDIGNGVTSDKVVSGYNQTCAIVDGNALKCWGLTYLEKEGMISESFPSSHMGENLKPINLGTGRSIAHIAIDSNDHVCVILDDNTIKCWGKNEYGQLGYGDTKTRGDEIGELGDNLPVVDLGL